MNASMTFAGALLSAALLSQTLGAQSRRLANGLEFRTPAGWQVTPSQHGAVLSPPNAAAGSETYLVALLPGVTDVQDRGVLARLAAQYSLNNVHATRVGGMMAFQTANGAGYVHSYDFVENGQQGRLQFYLVPVRTGVAAVVAAGTREIIPARGPALLSIASSLTQGTVATQVAETPAPASGGGPLAEQWTARLSGKKLMQFSSYSSGTSGGYSSQKTLALAADGSYSFRTSSSVSLYVPGATGGSAGRNGSNGRWRVYEQNGQATLELAPTQGSREVITLTTDGRSTFLNGHKWLVGSM
jgi:hypothetical protein